MNKEKISDIPHIESESEKSESEVRIEQLDQAVEKIKLELGASEKEKIKAIILFGSTARGEATKASDIEIHVDLEPFDPNTFNKIRTSIENKLPDTLFTFTNQKIIEGGRMAKLITAQKCLEKPASWKFLYTRSDKEEDTLNEILLKAQSHHQEITPK